MALSLRTFVAAAALLALVFATGCAAPCDRYCNKTADFIEVCLESGSSGEWQTASASGWAYWGATDKDQYVDDCKSDMKEQLAVADKETLEGACEDDANLYTEWADRGSCVDLP